MLIYVQRTGALFNSKNKRIAFGYSGFEEGKNNPEMQDVKGKGPIPCGAYVIGPLCDSKRTGKDILHLMPYDGTETFGRADFECHGDSSEHPGAASHGCIVLSLPARLLVNSDPDRRVIVVAEESDVPWGETK